jgi:hypothetical protein
MTTATLTPAAPTTPADCKVSALYARLAAIDPAAVPVVCTDRHVARKYQATLARELFKALGLKGISVTTPNYSMAHVVDVSIPSLPHLPGDYLYDGRNYENDSYSDMPAAVPARAKSLARHAASLKVGEILAYAFPNHDDRSDSQSDYFDSCWSIS